MTTIYTYVDPLNMDTLTSQWNVNYSNVNHLYNGYSYINLQLSNGLWAEADGYFQYVTYNFGSYGIWPVPTPNSYLTDLYIGSFSGNTLYYSYEIHTFISGAEIYAPIYNALIHGQTPTFNLASLINATLGGADIIVGAGANDLLRGYGGNDIVNGAGGNDQVFGGDGADTLNGGAGDDTVSGEAGNDIVSGAIGNDFVSGGTGNDTVNGDDGNDTLSGDSGNDTLNGGNGTDTAVLSGLASTWTFARLSATSVRATSTSGEVDVLNLVEQVRFGDNSIRQLTVADLLANTASPFDDQYNGDGGNNVFDGLAGNDTILGNDGNDNLKGGVGNDVLDGGAGDDFMEGGPGNDTYVVDSLGDAVVEQSPAVVGSGIDAVQTALLEFTLMNNVEQLVYTGTGEFAGTGNALNNRLTGGVGDDALDGLGGNDVLDGGAGDDALSGGTGADVMIGGAGDDAFVVDNAADRVVEALNAGVDVILTALPSLNLAAVDPATMAPLYANVDAILYTGGGNFTGIGNALDNLIGGGAGNDTLNGAAGNDILVGGAGNDTLIGGPGTGDTAVLSGLSTDYVFARLSTITVRVTNLNTNEVDLLTDVEQVRFGDNSIGQLNPQGLLANTASPFDDSYNGGSGVDTFDGLAGNDAINGNDGNDNLTGGLGNDTLDGGAGDDVMTGGLGNDTYIVDSLADQVVEQSPAVVGSGIDVARTALPSLTLAANVENLIYTGLGNFTGTGNILANRLTGGAGNDTLNGDANNDVLDGGAGDDTLNGGAGADVMIGGTGDDAFVVDNPADRIVEGLNAGFDAILTALPSLSLAAVDPVTMAPLYANVDILLYTGGANFTGTGNALDNSIGGGAGNDVLNGAAGNDFLSGGAGNDTLTGGVGNDTAVLTGVASDYVFARLSATSVRATHGAEVDVFNTIEQVLFLGDHSTRQLTIEDLLANTASPFDDLYNGGSGVDTFDGLAGNDTISGNDGNDNLTGGAGNDTLNGGAGDDVMNGGLGNDTYVVDSLADQVIDLAPAVVGSGIDVVQTALPSLTLAANVENLVYTGGGNFSGTGNNLANRLTGGAGNDTLNGDLNNDILDGGLGNDTLNGGVGADVMIGGAGDDTFVIDNPADRVVEVALTGGTDTIQTAMAALNLAAVDPVSLAPLYANVDNLTYTGGGNFSGVGNALDNVITGGAGNDLLNGGSAGNDTLIGGAGNDTLTGGTGNDTAVLSGVATDWVFLRLSATSVRAVNGGETDVLNTIELVRFAGDDSVRQLTMGDLLANTASVFDDVYNGGSGNDTFDGLAGSDILNGNDGNDNLIGGAGNDTLDGGAGVDVMTGGLGNDTYIVDHVGDSIIEAAPSVVGSGIDVEKTAMSSLTLAANVEQLIYTGSGDFTGAGNILPNLLKGGAGNDTLDGDAGNDTLDGGAGNDLLIGGLGADTMIGGAGDDSFVIDSAGDRVVEVALNGGTDTLKTALSALNMNAVDPVTLAPLYANVENLTYTGGGNFTGVGNALNNVLTGGIGNDVLSGAAGNDTLVGGAGNDTLVGGPGSDTLTGGAGSDVFVFSTAPGATNVDTITDFTSSDGNALAVDADHLRLAIAAFPALGAIGTLAEPKLAVGNFTTGQDLFDRLIYNTTTGDLYYDPDGSGAAASIQIAHLGIPSLDNLDITVVL